MVYRGHIENGVVVLDEPGTLPEGMAVVVEPASPPPDFSGKGMRNLIGLFPKEDLQQIADALKDCRQIDPDGW